MELVILKQDSQEYKYMWDTLANNPINDGLADKYAAENEGEVWQYMGSNYHDGKIIHSFRHRLHIKTGERVNISINGSNIFDESQIEKRIKLK